MPHIAAVFLALSIGFMASGADAKDSEAGATFEPRGSAGAGTEARVAAPPARSQAPSASTDLAPTNPTLAELPAASDVPPRSESAGQVTQNSLQSGNLFTLRVCNRSSTSARVAVTRREEGSNGWRVEGWWRVSPSDCANLGIFPRGWVYYYADATDGGSWTGQTVRKCVRYPGPFTRFEGGGNYTCGSDERLKGFNGTFVEDEISTHTWNLNP